MVVVTKRIEPYFYWRMGYYVCIVVLRSIKTRQTNTFKNSILLNHMVLSYENDGLREQKTFPGIIDFVSLTF